MIVGDLIGSLKRPVDLILITTGKNKDYLFDGYRSDIPLEIQELEVMNWEVTVKIEMQSMCEVNSVFTLEIETMTDITQ